MTTKMFEGMSFWQSVLTLIGSFVVAVIFVVPLGIYNYIVYGWALTMLWGWFAVPLFHVPALNIAQAIGISMIIRLFTPMPEDKGEEDKRETAKKVIDTVIALLVPFTTVGIGWVVYTYFIIH